MDAPKITFKSEGRTDDASRHLEVEGLPDLTYKSHTWRRGDVERTWRADSAILRWDHGVLHTVGLRGTRLKKDGTTGVIPDSNHWPVRDGKVQVDGRYPGYEVHLQPIVDKHGEVPPFNGPRKRREL